ncbi:hypothetical protein PSP20601_03858 [Pandoraea sputorum]|uniref:Uncharacterized protein n=1 Tax=Pandoraea sputorum TaxID=93222 RepID=A0A239SXB1_9BURK|nr:Uncharacterised protein [Pandoraea sputorum]VVE35405.1 hypothetical protein PSP20601_03858 [Pandoraea sputorum]VVE84371.1 hypothetical protein PSP31120_04617 [Pandoraea sputorum]
MVRLCKDRIPFREPASLQSFPSDEVVTRIALHDAQPLIRRGAPAMLL